VKKIVILGPESTGKSVLSEQLATHYNTIWCPEYAREYLLKNGVDYSYDDLLTIAKGQLELEDRCEEEVRKTESPGDRKIASESLKNSPNYGNDSSGLPDFRSSGLSSGLLFIDTNMYVMKVWCEFVFGKCHRFILEQIVEREYDLYLLCNTDLPWIKDELREYPDLSTRNKLYKMYEDIMINQPVPWIEISGNYEDRLRKAIDAVETLL